jgi:hypothetical protein
VLKLRRIAPLVAGVTVVGGVVAQTAPADAATHSVTCGGYELCLWYSSGSGSGIWRTDQSIVWSNFSYDYVLPKTPTYDHFTGGNGSGQGVRNNAHSVEDGRDGGDVLYSLPDLKGVQWGVPQYEPEKAVEIASSLRNNNASYKSLGCSINYGGVEIC